VAEERQVEIDLFVGGAVERADRRLGEAAARAYLSGVKLHLRLAILLAHLAELLFPNDLRVMQDHPREVLELLFRWIGGPVLLGDRVTAAVAEKLPRIDAQ